MMIVNGASIRFRNKARIELAAKARFLFGKQIMPPDGADSPARRIYFALQTAYIGTDEERAARAGRCKAADRANSRRRRPRRWRGRFWTARWRRPEADDCYTALKLVRRVIRHEDAVLGAAAIEEWGRASYTERYPRLRIDRDGRRDPDHRFGSIPAAELLLRFRRRQGIGACALVRGAVARSRCRVQTTALDRRRCRGALSGGDTDAHNGVRLVNQCVPLAAGEHSNTAWQFSTLPSRPGHWQRRQPIGLPVWRSCSRR